MLRRLVTNYFLFDPEQLNRGFWPTRVSVSVNPCCWWRHSSQKQTHWWFQKGGTETLACNERLELDCCCWLHGVVGSWRAAIGAIAGCEGVSWLAFVLCLPLWKKSHLNLLLTKIVQGVRWVIVVLAVCGWCWYRWRCAVFSSPVGPDHSAPAVQVLETIGNQLKPLAHGLWQPFFFQVALRLWITTFQISSTFGLPATDRTFCLCLRWTIFVIFRVAWAGSDPGLPDLPMTKSEKNKLLCTLQVHGRGWPLKQQPVLGQTVSRGRRHWKFAVVQLTKLMRLQNRFQKGSQSAGDLALSVAFQHKGFMSDPDLLTSQKKWGAAVPFKGLSSMESSCFMQI